MPHSWPSLFVLGTYSLVSLIIFSHVDSVEFSGVPGLVDQISVKVFFELFFMHVETSSVFGRAGGVVSFDFIVAVIKLTFMGCHLFLFELSDLSYNLVTF